MDQSCPHCQKKIPLYKNKVFVLIVVTLALLFLSLFFNFLVSFRVSFLSYLSKIWWAVLLGIILGGVIDYYIPHEYISKILASNKPTTIFNAVFLGFLMSACSHGILALSIQLHKKGASGPAVVSFLLSSPWANMAITFMLVSLFGLKGIFIIIAAVIIAINTGLIFMLLENNGLIERNNNTVKISSGFSVRADIKRRVKGYKFSLSGVSSSIKGIAKGAASLSNMVLWWIIIGMLIASFAGAYIPAHIFHKFMGPTFIGLLITLLLATLIEVCSEGSSPVAFEIYRQTGALGNSFVFLMAGVATDYTEIGLLWSNVGRRTALWMVVVTLPQIIILGLAANALLK